MVSCKPAFLGRGRGFISEYRKHDENAAESAEKMHPANAGWSVTLAIGECHWRVTPGTACVVGSANAVKGSSHGLPVMLL